MMNQIFENRSSQSDSLLVELTDYICKPVQFSAIARETGAMTLLDSIGCAFAAIGVPECRAHLGSLVAGSESHEGAKVLGTGQLFDPVKAAFDNGTLIRWLDFNDTWLAAEWGHPSDNFGALLALADYRCRNQDLGKPVTIAELIDFAIQAYEIQGILALANSFNKVGLDHVLLVRIASAGVSAKMAGGQWNEVLSALSNAWVDGSSLRTYRHAPNVTQRKSWAAGDATSRGCRLGLMATLAGLPALPTAISTPRWGFADALFAGNQPTLARKLDSYVMENILFKVVWPAEFHAQTAIECALELQEQFSQNRERLKRIEIYTQLPAIEIIAKTGELNNFADRDHCLQYIIAVALLEADVKSEHYADNYSRLQEADKLRQLMTVNEDKQFSKDYLDPNKRSITNAIQLVYEGEEKSQLAKVEYPLGHRRRRDEAKPLLIEKFRTAATNAGAKHAERIIETFANGKLDEILVSQLVDDCQILND